MKALTKRTGTLYESFTCDLARGNSAGGAWNRTVDVYEADAVDALVADGICLCP